jgi:protocatechuate 3,4-dioxygenase beta subunit
MERDDRPPAEPPPDGIHRAQPPLPDAVAATDIERQQDGGGLKGMLRQLESDPVPYPGRTPHIHFAVSGNGFERLVTQMYVAGEPGNESDPVLMGVRDPTARARLIVALRPSPDVGPAGLDGTFDIVIGGHG